MSTLSYRFARAAASRQSLRFERLEDRLVLTGFPTLPDLATAGVPVLTNHFGQAQVTGVLADGETAEFRFVTETDGAATAQDTVIWTVGSTDTRLAYYAAAGDPAIIDENGGQSGNARINVIRGGEPDPVVVSVATAAGTSGPFTLNFNAPNETPGGPDLTDPDDFIGFFSEFDQSSSVEWFVLTIPTTGEWTFVLSPDAAVDASLALFDFGGPLLAGIDPSRGIDDRGLGGAETFTGAFNQGDEVVLRVDRVGGSTDLAEFSVLAVGPAAFPSFPTPLPTVLQPNQFGQLAIEASLDNAGEFDRYLIDGVNTTGPASFETVSLNDMVMAYYNGPGRPAAVDDDSGDVFNPRIETTIIDPDAPVAVVTRGYSAEFGIGPYSLVVDVPAPTLQEVAIDPTNNFGFRDATLGVDDSGEWFDFVAPVAGEWTITAAAIDPMDVSLFVFDEQGESLSALVTGAAQQPIDQIGDAGAEQITVSLNAGERAALYVRKEFSFQPSGKILVEIDGPAAFPNFPFVNSIELITNQFGDADFTAVPSPPGAPQNYTFVTEATGTGEIDVTVGATDLAYFEGASATPAAVNSGVGPQGGPSITATIAGEPTPTGVSVVADSQYTLLIDARDESPTMIPIDGTFNLGRSFGSVAGEAEVDWLEFFPEIEGEWTITIETLGDLDVSLAVFDRNGESLSAAVTGNRHLPIDAGGEGFDETFMFTVGPDDLFDEIAFRVDTVGGTSGAYTATILGPSPFVERVSLSGDDQGYLATNQFGDILDVESFGNEVSGFFPSFEETHFYSVANQDAGTAEFNATGNVILAYYPGSGLPQVAMISPDFADEGIQATMSGDGLHGVLAVRGEGSYSLNGFLPEPSQIDEIDFNLNDDIEGRASTDTRGEFEPEWYRFETVVGGNHEVDTESGFFANIVAFDQFGDVIATVDRDFDLALNEGEVVFLRVTRDGGSIFDDRLTVTVENDGSLGEIFLDIFTTPFVISDPLAATVTAALAWQSSGGAEEFQLALQKQVGGVFIENQNFATVHAESISGNGSAPLFNYRDPDNNFQLTPVEELPLIHAAEAANNGVIDPDAVYRLRLRTNDPDGTFTIGGVEIDNLRLTSVRPIDLPGDYNQDGSVDGIDYAAWRTGLNQPYTARLDGNNDGQIDAGDLEVWRSNFGANAPSEIGWDFNSGFPAQWSESGNDFVYFTSIGAAQLGGGSEGNVLRIEPRSPSFPAGFELTAAAVPIPLEGQAEGTDRLPSRRNFRAEVRPLAIHSRNDELTLLFDASDRRAAERHLTEDDNFKRHRAIEAIDVAFETANFAPYALLTASSVWR